MNTNYSLVKILQSKDLIVELQYYENDMIAQSDKHIIRKDTLVNVKDSLNKSKPIKANNFIYNTFDCFFSDDEDKDNDITSTRLKYGNMIKQENNEDSRNKFDMNINEEEFEYLNDIKVELPFEIKVPKNEEKLISNTIKLNQFEEVITNNEPQIKSKEQEKDHKYGSLLNLNSARSKKINTTSYNLREEIKNNSFYDIYPGFDMLDIGQPKIRTPKGKIMKKDKSDEIINPLEE